MITLMAVVFKLASRLATILIVLAVLAMCVGVKPKPCPRHICLPKECITTAEELVAMRKAGVEPQPKC